MVIALPFLVMIVGLIIYLVVQDGKIAALGKDMFWVGLLVTLLGAGPYVTHFVTH